MPRISVVVPVYRVAGYLPACLDSILDGGGAGSVPGGIEVIAVDDASPDASGAILDERAAADPRLRVVHLDRNRGQGHARNLGLELAAGDYVWFVDGDDCLTEGALAAVAAALAASNPDVLLVNWVSCYPGGRTEPSPGAGLLGQVPPAGCTLAELPSLIELSMTSWSKLFRRDFLRGLGVRFADGIHEDIPVTCAALLDADVIGAVTQVCYRYRRDRPGAAMATTSAGHGAVFAAYERVFRMLADRDAARRPVSPVLRAAIFERAIIHFSAVLEARRGSGFGRAGLVPRRRRRAFFRQMHENFVRHRPTNYRRPSGPRGARLGLVERGAYGGYCLLAPLNQARLALRRLVQAR